MALNFSKAYTFSPSTTAVSGQVNTNFDDIASVFQGLEAETKTLAKLKVDIDPTLALEVATKQYVDHYSTYRRPVLQYNSGTVVNIETGINGTSGQAQILFPDGNLRTDSTSTRINCNLAQVAALAGTAQSGLRTGTVANNTWYAIYAVKTTDNSSNFVSVADIVVPTQANYATLNSNFGTSGWVYLGYVRYGDGSGTANAIIKFTQAGNTTFLRNAVTANAGAATNGFRIATTAGAASLTWSYSAGTSGAVVPDTIQAILFNAESGIRGAAVWQCTNSAGAYVFCQAAGAATAIVQRLWTPAAEGLFVTNAAAATSDAFDICVAGWVDGVLGVGSNPIL